MDKEQVRRVMVRTCEIVAEQDAEGGDARWGWPAEDVAYSLGHRKTGTWQQAFDQAFAEVCGEPKPAPCIRMVVLVTNQADHEDALYVDGRLRCTHRAIEVQELYRYCPGPMLLTLVSTRLESDRWPKQLAEFPAFEHIQQLTLSAWNSSEFWRQAPPWATAAAVDSNGLVYYYEKTPDIVHHAWYSSRSKRISPATVSGIPPSSQWRDSLILRPTTERETESEPDPATLPLNDVRGHKFWRAREWDWIDVTQWGYLFANLSEPTVNRGDAWIGGDIQYNYGSASDFLGLPPESEWPWKMKRPDGPGFAYRTPAEREAWAAYQRGEYQSVEDRLAELRAAKLDTFEYFAAAQVVGGEA